MRANAAVLTSFGQPLEMQEIVVPALEPGQVLVEIEAAGVCGSDVHMWQGRDPRTPLPMILGHEGVGRIVDVEGPLVDVQGQPLAIGERILWERGVTCGRCHACAVLGEPSLCSERWVYGIYRGMDTPPHLNGCYASHIILDAKTHLIRLDKAQDPAIYVPCSCSGATAAHGFDLSPAQVGDVVVVLGPGPLGAFSCALARADGAAKIVVIGGTDERLALCQALGATHLLDRHAMSLAERREAVLDLSHGRGADLVVEASGNVAAASEGLDMVRHGGALSLVGFGTPVGEMTFAPFEQVVRKNVRVQGVWVSDVRHTLQAISLVQRDPAPFAAMITHRFALDRATLALQTVAQRQAMKAVIEPNVAS